MRWVPFFILAYVAVAMQTALRGLIEVRGFHPNLPVLVVVFVAIHAAREPALLGCFFVGVMQDLVSGRPLGLYALAYGLIGLVLLPTQSVVYREHPLTHIVLSFLASLMTQAVVLLNGLRHAPRLEPASVFGEPLYTAAVSIVVLGLLVRMRRAFGFTAQRRSVSTTRTVSRAAE